MQAQLNRKTIFKSIDVKINNPPASSVLQASGASLGEVLEMGVAGGSQTVTIKLTAGRKKYETIKPRIVRDLIKKITGGDYQVESFKIGAKDDSDDRTEILDLMNAILRTRIDVLPGPDRELPRNLRIQALKKAMAAWTKQGLT